MHSHFTNKLLNLEDVIVKKVVHADTFVKIYIETKPKEHLCPCCGLSTKRIHDYSFQTIKDLPFQLKHWYLVLRKRRYLCSCGKRFFEICQNPKYSEQRTDFFDWIKMAENSGLKEFEDCAKTYRHWSKERLHAFKYKFISNGPTEGFNNKIKVLKRTSYGVRNFERFRTRILLATN